VLRVFLVSPASSHGVSPLKLSTKISLDGLMMAANVTNTGLVDAASAKRGYAKAADVVPGAPTTPVIPTAAPGPWTVDTVIIWLAAGFYCVVTAAAAMYFVKRWRKRAYGAGGASSMRGACGKEERTALRSGGGSADGDVGFIATISAMIDRVTNRTALDGAAAFQDGGRFGTRYRPGAGNALLRKIAPYLPGAQGRAAAARRNKEKDEAVEEVVEVDVSNSVGGVGVGVGAPGGRAEGSPSPRHVGSTSPAPGGGGIVDGGALPPGGMPPTMIARDPGH
jgi:hypothetical protein